MPQFHSDFVDAERQSQVAEARRLASQEGEVAPRRPGGTLSVRRSSFDAPKKSKAPLKGHEAFIKALEMSGADVVIEKVSSGLIYHGKIKHSDKYTLTVNVTAIYTMNGDVSGVDFKPCDRVIFKHDISEFYTTTPRPAHDNYKTAEGHAV